MGTAAEMMLMPYGSLIIGFICGIISTLGFVYLTVRAPGQGLGAGECWGLCVPDSGGRSLGRGWGTGESGVSLYLEPPESWPPHIVPQPPA